MVVYICRGRRIAAIPWSAWATNLNPISKGRKRGWRGGEKERKGVREGRRRERRRERGQGLERRLSG